MRAKDQIWETIWGIKLCSPHIPVLAHRMDTAAIFHITGSEIVSLCICKLFLFPLLQAESPARQALS